MKTEEAMNRLRTQKRELEAMQLVFSWLPRFKEINTENVADIKDLYCKLIPTQHAAARSAFERNSLFGYMNKTSDPVEKTRLHRLIAESDIRSGLVYSSHVRKFPDLWDLVQPQVREFEAAYVGPIFTTTWPSYSRGFALVRRFEFEKYKFEGTRILHISPESEVKAWFENNAKQQNMTYHTLNLGGDVDFVEDLTSMHISSNQYDWVICHRVLEHIFDDEAAIRETHRILKPGGRFNVSVPESMHINEDEFWAIPDLTHHHHYRQYGSAFSSKLESNGFRSTLVEATLNVKMSDGTYPFRMYDAIAEK